MEYSNNGSSTQAQNGLKPGKILFGVTSALMGASVPLLAPKYQAPVAGAAAGLLGAAYAVEGLTRGRYNG